MPAGDVALVMGSEGSGIRRLVRENCDVAAYVPIDSAMESLNVSNAAAVALYEIRRADHEAVLGLDRRVSPISGRGARGNPMRSCLLVLLGVPLPVVFLLWFLTGHL